MGIDRDFDRIANDQIDFDALEKTLDSLHQDPNWQTRSLKLREELAKHEIEVRCTGQANLGRCYNAQSFEVLSDKELPDSFVVFLRKIGLLGYGQEFWFDNLSQEDGTFIVKAQSRCDSSD